MDKPTIKVIPGPVAPRPMATAEIPLTHGRPPKGATKFTQIGEAVIAAGLLSLDGAAGVPSDATLVLVERKGDDGPQVFASFVWTE